MRDDGTWSIWFEGPPDLSTTIEAYVALRMAGAETDPQTVAYILREGGIPKARIFTKAFMALLGQWPWQRMTPIPSSSSCCRLGTALDLRLRLLGAADVRRARGRRAPCAPCGRSPLDLHAIGARPGESRPPARPRRCRRCGGEHSRRRALDPRAPGGGRLLGRDPAAVGLVAPLPRRARPRPRGRDPPPRGRRLGRLHDRRRRPPAARGMPVAGLGHGARRARACAPAASRPSTRSSRRAGE